MVSINISDMVAGEQNNSAYMVVQLSAPSANTVSVNYATNNDTAHSGSDYVSTSGTLNFSPGETTKVVRVELVDDNITEDYQRFSFNLSNPTNATIPKSTAWIGIIDDESAPGLILFSPADEAAGVAVSSNTEITFSEAIQWPRHISIYGIPPSGQGATVLNTTGVPVNSNIEITYTEEIQLGVGGIVLKDFGGTIIETFDAASSSQLMISGKTLTIDPTADLASNTGYSVKFENGSIQDLAGNSYTGMTGYNFLTADIIAPTVISFNPADEAIGVAADSNIVLTFSEVIQRGTGSIVLKTADGTTVETFDAATSGHLLISDSTLIIDLTNNLADGTNYFVALDPGTIKDLAGNAYVGTNTYDFTTATFTGTAGNDTISGGAFNDIINGGAGIDTVTFSGNFSDYQITKTGPGYTLTSASGDTDILTNVEHLQFADRSVNLTIQNTAMGIDSAAVQRIEELYVAFFNRVPDADGLEAWMIAFKNGASINSIAEDFYDAGISYSALTGYSAGMSNEDFVNTIYRNVLGRVDGADPLGLASWSGELASGRETHGSLVSSILESAHTFKGDTTWGWVADLLDNKIQVADTFAVDWGMGYNTPEASITHGMAIAAAVTPLDTAAAISLIGIQNGHINLG